jgi:hypothetical protein
MCLEKDARPFHLNSQPLARGGEAAIYEIPHEPGLVAKVYYQPTAAHADKVAAMLAAPPTDPMAGRGHVSIAWPVDRLVECRTPRFLGYVMPRVDRVRSILEFYNPASRLQMCPLFHYGYLLRTARNLAAAVRAIHERGYVIGDLNESNVLVSNMALITLVDTDSFQVPSSVQVHRCPVGKPEYTPPELQGARFADFDRGPEHDAFALAILVFQLLMQGIHPFAGRYIEPGEPAGLGERIAAGHWPYVRGRRVPFAPNPHAPGFDTLPPQVQELMRRCFEDGHVRSSLRPSAAAWHQALQESESALAACPANSKQHIFARHLKSCPWCELARRQGRDLFPSPEEVQAGRVGIRRTAAKPPEIVQVPLAPAPMGRDFVSRDAPAAMAVGSARGSYPVAQIAPAPAHSSDLPQAPAIPRDAVAAVWQPTPSSPPGDLEVRPALIVAPPRRPLLWPWLAGVGGLVLFLALGLILVFSNKGTKVRETEAEREPEPEKVAELKAEKKEVPAKKDPLIRPLDGAPVLDPELAALLRDAVQKKNYTQTAIVGFALDTAFEEVPPEGGLLIGFEVGLGNPNDVIHSLRPIFLTEKGEVLGQIHGKPGERVVTVKAKKGYAVGGVSVSWHVLIDGIKITFMRVDKKFLDADQSYQSENIGSIGGAFRTTTVIGGSGALVMGICGRSNGQFGNALGLVLRGKVK